RLESNFWPLLASQPVYCTLTDAPGLTTAPEPALRSTYPRPSGNLTGVLLAPSLKSSAPDDGGGVVSPTVAVGPRSGVGSGYPHAATRKTASAPAAAVWRALDRMVGVLAYAVAAGARHRAASRTRVARTPASTHATPAQM